MEPLGKRAGAQSESKTTGNPRTIKYAYEKPSEPRKMNGFVEIFLLFLFSPHFFFPAILLVFAWVMERPAVWLGERFGANGAVAVFIGALLAAATLLVLLGRRKQKPK